MHCIRKQGIVSCTLWYGCSRCSLAWLPLFLWRRSELALECFVTDQTGTARLSTRTRTSLKLNINERLPIPKNSPCCFIAVIKSAVLTRQLRTCSDWDWQSINSRAAAAAAAIRQSAYSNIIGSLMCSVYRTTANHETKRHLCWELPFGIQAWPVKFVEVTCLICIIYSGWTLFKDKSVRISV